MGGINNQKGVKPTSKDTNIHHPLTTATQEVVLHVMKCAQHFYAMHVELELGVLAEGRKNKSTKHVTEAGDVSSEITKELSKAKDVLLDNTALVKKEGTWHAPYFELMLARIEEQLDVASKLAIAVSSEDVIKSAMQGELQDSMWNEGANAKIRLLSVEFVQKLSSLLSAHTSFVQITNVENSIFIE